MKTARTALKRALSVFEDAGLALICKRVKTYSCAKRRTVSAMLGAVRSVERTCLKCHGGERVPIFSAAFSYSLTRISEP